MGKWKKEEGEKAPRLVTSFYDDGERMYEQLRSTTYGYAVYERKTGRVQFKSAPEVNGKILTQLDPEAVEKGLVLLPESPEEYGTEKELLEEIQQHIHDWVDISEEMEKFAAYYILMSWVYDRMNTVCYLRALGDTGSGKTRFLDTVGRLCYKATMVSGAATAAPIFRLLEYWKGTLVIDEADFAKSDTHQEIIKILNTGFERGKPVIRANKEDPTRIEVHRVYGPKVLSTRYTFTDKALESRCLTEKMMETNRDIPVVLPSRFYKREMELRNKLLMYRFKNYDKIDSDQTAGYLEGIEPRLRQATQSFAVLFNDQPELAGEFKSFMQNYQKDLIEERASSWEGLIVNSIYTLLESGKEFITASDIVEKVNEGTTRKEELSSRRIGRIIKSLGLETKLKRIGLETKRVLEINHEIMPKLYKRYVPDFKSKSNVGNESNIAGGYSGKLLVGDVLIGEEGGVRSNVTNVTNVTKYQKVIEYLRNNNGHVLGCSMTDIAKNCGIPPEEIGGLVSELEHEGAVMRGPNGLVVLSRKEV